MNAKIDWLFLPKKPLQMKKVRMDNQQTATGRHIYRRAFICFAVLLVLIAIYPGMDPAVCANEVKQGDKVTIVTPGTEARLCPQPGCGPNQHIARIPAGTVLTIQGTEVFAIGTFKVKWFEVVYHTHRGWISIYDTDLAKR
jgi:hypothetical protein